MGKETRKSNILMNSEFKKVNRKKGDFESDTREMTEEGLLEMLSQHNLATVKSIAASCKIPAVGNKFEIIVKIKNAMAKNDDNLKKIFSKLWGHSGGCGDTVVGG